MHQRLHVDLFNQPRLVSADGLETQVHDLGDLLVAQAFCQILQNGQFTVGKQVNQLFLTALQRPHRNETRR
ncbi:hypothetical protein D3C71_1931500 [compost metagenome]